MDRKPVLFCLESLGTGGAERLVLDIAKALDRDRFEPFAASLYGGTLREEIENAGIPVCVLDKHPGVDLSLAIKLARFIRNNGIRVVNAHHFSPFFYSFLALRLCPGVRLVHTEHTVREFEEIPSRWKWLFERMMRRADVNLAISRAIAVRFRTVLSSDKDRIVTIVNGIDFRRFDEAGPPISRAELGVSGECPLVGMFGNFREQKNHRNLLAAFRSILCDIPDARLLLAGEGELLGPMIEYASALGIGERVCFLGPRLDLPRIYPLLSAYCLPSHYEGLPLTLLEAMACGVAVVATDVPGNNEVVRDGENGLLVVPNDPDALSSGLRRLLQDGALSRRLASSGRDEARRKYGLDGMIHKYEELFDSLAAGNGNFA